MSSQSTGHSAAGVPPPLHGSPPDEDETGPEDAATEELEGTNDVDVMPPLEEPPPAEDDPAAEVAATDVAVLEDDGPTPLDEVPVRDELLVPLVPALEDATLELLAGRLLLLGRRLEDDGPRLLLRLLPPPLVMALEPDAPDPADEPWLALPELLPAAPPTWHTPSLQAYPSPPQSAAVVQVATWRQSGHPAASSVPSSAAQVVRRCPGSRSIPERAFNIHPM